MSEEEEFAKRGAAISEYKNVHIRKISNHLRSSLMYEIKSNRWESCFSILAQLMQMSGRIEGITFAEEVYLGKAHIGELNNE